MCCASFSSARRRCSSLPAFAKISAKESALIMTQQFATNEARSSACPGNAFNRGPNGRLRFRHAALRTFQRGSLNNMGDKLI